MTNTSWLKRASLLATGVFALILSTASTAWAECSDPARPYVDWSGCDKTGVRLHRVIMAEAQLRGTILIDAFLFRTDLRGADLAGADLTDAMLGMAILTNADLQGADLEGAVLRGAYLEGAKLTGAVWTDGRICGHGSVGECRELDQ